MTTVNLQAPMPYQTFATRRGTFTSDEDGIIYDVPYASQAHQDLLGAGCTVIPPSKAPTGQPQS
jgi:hypothetical protein